jgi:hypothetical protein
MLIDDLAASLREHADSVRSEPAVTLAGVADRTRRHNRSRRLAPIATLVLVSGVIVGAVHLTTTHSSGTGRVSGAGAVRVPCDTPTRTVPQFLDWPCPTGSFSRYYSQQTQAFQQEADVLFAREPAADLEVRVLGFGPVPNGRPGSTVVFAELWQRGGRTAALLGYNFAKPAQFSPNSDEAPADDAVVFPYLVGPMPAGNPQLLVTGRSGTFAVTSRTECRAIASNRARLTISHPGSCSDTVLARPGIAAIRVVEGVGHFGPVIPVRAGLAALADHVHPTWTIQGLSSTGAVLASAPYDPMPGLGPRGAP